MIATAAVAVLGGAFGGGTDGGAPRAQPASRRPGGARPAAVRSRERRLRRLRERARAAAGPPPRGPRHAAAAGLRLPAARPGNGRPKLLLALRARARPGAALADRGRAGRHRARGARGLASPLRRCDPAGPRGASRRPEERDRLRRTGRCPPEPRPLPGGVRRLRPDGRALAERRLVRPDRPRPRAARTAARRGGGPPARAHPRRLAARAPRGRPRPARATSRFGVGRPPTALAARMRPRLPRGRATCTPRPGSPGSRPRAATTDVPPPSCAASSARLPLPQYAIWHGDVLRAAGRGSEAGRAYAAGRGHRSGSRRRTACAPSSRPRSSTSTTAAASADALARAREEYARAPSIDAADVLAWALERNGRCREALALLAAGAPAGHA